MPPQSCQARVEAFKRNMFRVGEVRVMRMPSAQVEGTVSATGANTFFGKTASMIQVRHLVGGGTGWRCMMRLLQLTNLPGGCDE